MKKLFVVVTIAVLGIILVSVCAHAGGLAFDRAGNLFMVDPDTHSIFKFTPDGNKSTFASGLSTDGLYDLAFDAAGNLFVSDEDSRSVLKFTPDGKKSTFVTGIRSLGIAFDRSGNLFVSQGDSILKFTPDGKKSTFATGFYSSGMAFDDKGNLFVPDRQHSIFEFTPDGTRSTFANDLSTVGGLGFETNSMVFDRSGNLFESDDRGQRIIKFSPDGTQSAFASGVRGGLAFDETGNLFVADPDSHSIFKFTPDGTGSTFAVYKRWFSPDKKWENIKGDEPKIVKASTNEVALDLSDECQGSVDWSPDSKRFAFNCRGGGRWNGGASLYQLGGDKWKTLKPPNDAVLEILNKTIAAQVKKRGLPKKTDLRLIWQTVRVDHWIDSNTAIVFGDLHEVVRENPETRFDVEFLFTLKFDEAGNWKIVKTHRMSGKEIDEHE